MEDFINSVKKYPCLWDPSLVEYKVRGIKYSAWRKVKEECGLPNIDETKNMWKNLRDGYRQALNKKKCSSRQANPWKYEKMMEFILPHMTNKPKITIVAFDDLPNDVQDETRNIIQDESQKNLREEPENSSQVNSNSYTCNKRKRKSQSSVKHHLHVNRRREKRVKSRDAQIREVMTRNYQRRQRHSSEHNSALKVFFDSMYESAITLPELSQLAVQRKIFDIVMEAREDDLSHRMQNSLPANVTNNDELFRLQSPTPASSISSPNRSHSSMSNSDIKFELV